MAYLKGFGLENFRVFKEYTWFDFAPITLLVGPNSSGKSSLIKALLLLRDNYNKRYIPVDHYGWLLKYNELLNFNNKNHNLLNESSIIPINREKGEMTFTLPYNGVTSLFGMGKGYPLYFDISYQIKDNQLFPSIMTKIRSKNEDLFISDAENGYVFLNMPLLSKIINTDVNSLVRERISQRDRNLSELNTVDLGDSHRHTHLDALRKKLSNMDLGKLAINYDTNGLWPKNSEVVLSLLKSYYPEDSYELAKMISDVLEIDSLQPAFRDWASYVYLPSMKKIPQRYIRFDDDTEVLNRLFSQLKEDRDKENKIVNSFVKKWTNAFGFKETINWQKDFDRGLTKVQIGDSYLSDVGFGISQLTAVLLANFAIDLNDKPDLLILEEPEANLHPAFQSKLADMFADSEKTLGHQFIIETHSEYMIRKFQYLVATGEMKSEDIVIYYFNNLGNVSSSEKQVKKITIEGDGSLSDDFGTGFYDEAAHWELELLKLKRNKNRQN